MIILGIDPGTHRVGYGVIKAGRDLKLLDAGLLRIKAAGRAERLLQIKNQFLNITKRFKPFTLAIEKLYFMKNQKTAISVAEARGAILLGAAETGLRVKEFSPNEIKAGITGYGFSDKKAVLKMVRLILHEPELEVVDDASDALAVAILAARGL